MTYVPKTQPKKQSEPEVVIDVDEYGNFSLDVLHGDGKNCRTLTEPLEAALGIIESSTTKPEYLRDQVVTTQVKTPGVKQYN